MSSEVTSHGAQPPTGGLSLGVGAPAHLDQRQDSTPPPPHAPGPPAQSPWSVTATQGQGAYHPMSQGRKWTPGEELMHPQEQQSGIRVQGPRTQRLMLGTGTPFSGGGSLE